MCRIGGLRDSQCLQCAFSTNSAGSHGHPGSCLGSPGSRDRSHSRRRPHGAQALRATRAPRLSTPGGSTAVPTGNRIMYLGPRDFQVPPTWASCGPSAGSAAVRNASENYSGFLGLSSGLFAQGIPEESAQESNLQMGGFARNPRFFFLVLEIIT